MEDLGSCDLVGTVCIDLILDDLSAFNLLSLSFQSLSPSANLLLSVVFRDARGYC